LHCEYDVTMHSTQDNAIEVLQCGEKYGRA
jgi:hypothetical protein